MIERRKVSWRRLARRHLLWLPLLPLAFALVFGTIGAVQVQKARLFAREGVDGSAQVVAREIRSRRDRDGNTTTERIVTYRFQSLSGETVQGVEAVSRGLYDSLAPGQPVAVRYLPGNPAVNTLEPGIGAFEVIILGVGLLALGIGGGLAAFLLRNKLSILRAARRGEVREARVTGHVVTGVKVNGRTQYRFRWVDAAGQEGESAMAALGDLPAEGAVVAVYVDPRTGRDWWEGDF